MSGAALASDEPPAGGLAEDAFFDRLPVVLSVSRLAQPLADAPGSVTVFDADAIRSSGAHDLADLLRMVPGFLVAHSANGAPNAVYHGMTDENPRGLQILVDGRSQYSPLFFGGVAWNLIDVSLDDIERIEVIRGSNSAAYGSNAFLGVVNVITRAAADTQLVRVRLGQGNDGVADRHARIGMRVGDAFVRLSAERMRDEGVIGFNDSRRNGRVNLRADLPLGFSDELQFQAGVVDMTLDAGQPGDTREPPRQIRAAKEFVSAGWSHHAADGVGLSVRYTRSRERYKDLFSASEPALDALAARIGLPSPYFVLIDQRIRTVRDELEFQHTVAPTESTRLVWGVGARHDSVRAEQFYGTHKEVKQQVHRLFGNIEWRPAAWSVNLGATWENDSLSDTSLAPRLSASYHLSPQQTLRAGITRAHRIPTLTESRARTAYGAFDSSLLGSQAGFVPVEITRNSSGGLDQETIDVQEIGYLGDFREQRVFVDVRAFREQVRDRIVPAILPLSAPNCDLLGLLARGCGEARDFLNGQDVDIRGLEYQVRWRPRSATELTLNQTYIAIDSRANSRLYVRDPAAAVAAERHMDRSAPDVATMLRWSERFKHGLEASITYYRYGRFQWTPDSSVGPFERTDLRLAYPFRMARTTGELALTVQGVGARRAEYRDAMIGSGRATVPASQFLHPRGWLSLVLGF
ncbi:TonB-dependent receptor plug domain-containing protein [Aromatoleum diolicum]|uniref:TonB-dependent receptor plug domain-containing protein n=1 Tax=Aromatoleum diolicum TaxID=75796 RepID=UPI0031B566E4